MKKAKRWRRTYWASSQRYPSRRQPPIWPHGYGAPTAGNYPTPSKPPSPARMTWRYYAQHQGFSSRPPGCSDAVSGMTAPRANSPMCSAYSIKPNASADVFRKCQSARLPDPVRLDKTMMAAKVGIQDFLLVSVSVCLNQRIIDEGPKLPYPWLVRRMEEVQIAKTPRAKCSLPCPAQSSCSAERTVCSELGTDQRGHVKLM